MNAATFEIIDRKRTDPVGFTTIKEFELRESAQIEAEEILANDNITLYALDFEKGQAVFVETASPAELSQAPFYYQAQYENTVRVITMPFETMIQLAQSLKIDDVKLIMIHSVGRSGSTLASQIFAQVSGVINMSEPDALTQLVIARLAQPDRQADIKALLDASMRLLCKTPAQTAWVIKGRSWVIELGDWLQELYPQTKNLYLYRDAETWLKSMFDAFADEVERTPEQQRDLENELRGWMKLLTPAIARYDPDQHLPVAGLVTLMWLSNMEKYTELHQAGIGMLAIPYSSWRLDPRRTVLAMLDYCHCRPTDLTAIEDTLTKDSQAGTALSQRTLKKKAKELQPDNVDEMNRQLKNHPYIQTSDFEVANTLKL
jgi:hypothetical protein